MTAIPAVYLSDLKVYTLTLPAGTYEIEGHNELLVLNEAQEVTLPSALGIKRLGYTTRVVGYTHVQTGEYISVDEYDSRIKQFTSDSATERVILDEYGDVQSATSLEIEYQFKKFKQGWVPQRQTILSDKREVVLNVRHVPYDTGTKYIVPIIQIDPPLGPPSNLGLVKYLKHQYQRQLVIEITREFGLSLEIPTHSHIYFAKVDGTYCFNTPYWKSVGDMRAERVRTLEDARQEMADDEIMIRDIIEYRAAEAKSKLAIVGEPATRVVAELESIISALRDVNPKQSSAKDLEAAIARCGKLSNALRKWVKQDKVEPLANEPA